MAAREELIRAQAELVLARYAMMETWERLNEMALEFMAAHRQLISNRVRTQFRAVDSLSARASSPRDGIQISQDHVKLRTLT